MNDWQNSTTPKPFGFVLMPFDAEFKNLYTYGIKGAAQDAGAYAERLDEQIFTEGMLERIYNQISKADFIVADMTGRNPNVFYEVGYAHALGKIVLLLTQNAKDIPFDLQHRQHIIYEGSKIELLRKSLTEKIVWAIAESRNRRGIRATERFLVSIRGTDIPASQLDGAPPIIDVASGDREIRVPICVRNGSPGVTPEISHIYVLIDPAAMLLPCEYRKVTVTNYTTGASHPSGLWDFAEIVDVVEPSSIVECTGQCRIKATIPPLPFGAIEVIRVVLSGVETYTYTETVLPMILRLHTTGSFYDYPFRLKIKPR